MENFRDNSSSDVRFEVEEYTIYAHKNILSYKSEMFYTMFYGSVKFEDSCIHVDDLSKKAFNTILKNIYTGIINFRNMDTGIFLEILYGAKKYMLKDLSLKCVEEINIKSYDSYRTLKLYLASSIHPEIDIEKCLDRLRRNDKFVFNSNEFLSPIDIIQKFIIHLNDKKWTAKQIIYEFLIKWAKKECTKSQNLVNSSPIISKLSESKFNLISDYMLYFSGLDMTELIREPKFLKDSEISDILIKRMSFFVNNYSSIISYDIFNSTILDLNFEIKEMAFISQLL